MNSEHSYVLDGLDTNSWRMFRIMSEIVDGFETLQGIPPCVSIFGSARATPDSALYKETEALSRKLAENGFGVITGGGPGLMEAGNKGASEAGGVSVGLHIHLPNEQVCNEWVRVRADFRYFFVRKLMFVKYATAYVVMPGGMGTMDEFSEAFVLAQTQRIRPFPIILYGSTFWNGFLGWMRSSMLESGFISKKELELITVLDDPDAVIAHIKNFVDA